MPSKTELNTLKFLTSLVKPKLRPEADKALKLYNNRSIANYKTILKIITQLSGRGGSQAAAIETIKKYEKKPSYFKIDKKQEINHMFIDAKTLMLNIDNQIKSINKLKLPVNEYYLSGVVHYDEIWIYKEKEYRYHHTMDEAETYRTYIKQQAIRAFKEDMYTLYTYADSHNRYEFQYIENLQVHQRAKQNDYKVENILMRKSKHMSYDFIPEDTTKLLNNDQCTVDNFLGTYQPLIKKLSYKKFIELCYQSQNIQNPNTKTKSRLDYGLDDEDDDDNDIWKISDGVSPKMMHYICKHFDIGHYCFDINKACYLRYESKNRNYPALVYYAVNNHMYHITNKTVVKSLIETAKDKELTILTSAFTDEEEKEDKFTDLEIKTDIKIEDLKDLKKCIVIYSKNNITEEFEQIIKVYGNIITKIKNHEHKIVRMYFNLNDVEIILMADPNDRAKITWEKVFEICLQHGITFRNQSFMVVINEIRSNWFKAIESRQDLPKPLKDLVFRKSHNKCSNPDCKTKSTQFEIDHIKPIANGGHPTKLSNLQLLCKPCHNVKSQSEKEFGYKKISDTESSFNIQTKEIFNSALCSSYAFIEKVADPKNKANKIYYLDINKCRKNILYFNQFDYPVFSVMDMPIAYTNQNCPGLYYVETDNYVPLRGNGWYYYPTIKYCLENNLIKHTDIKYVIQSSLTLKHNHYNSFIDFCYDPENLDKDLSKLAINGMIGQFKPKPRDNWQSIITTSDKNEAMNHLLKFKTSFLDCHHINFADEENPQFEDFYHVYKRTSVLKEETEAPIYNMILELEAIELHKLKTLVESHKGTVLDLNTDCVTCVFRNNKLPFELIKDSDNYI